MKDFVLHILTHEGQIEAKDFINVDVGFNQFGWLVFTDRNREPVALYPPGTVKDVEELNRPEVIDIQADQLIDVVN